MLKVQAIRTDKFLGIKEGGKYSATTFNTINGTLIKVQVGKQLVRFNSNDFKIVNE